LNSTTIDEPATAMLGGGTSPPVSSHEPTVRVGPQLAPPSVLTLTFQRTASESNPMSATTLFGPRAMAGWAYGNGTLRLLPQLEPPLAELRMNSPPVVWDSTLTWAPDVAIVTSTTFLPDGLSWRVADHVRPLSVEVRTRVVRLDR
jgi:hypothetical protein